MSQDRISVVMATCNGAAHLAEQLASLSRQSHSDWRLFVSDDGSTDATRDMVRDFARHHDVTLVEGPRKGAAANFLSALCHPDLPPGPVALADQDDIWFPGKLARGLRRIQAAGADGHPVLYAAESTLADAEGRPFRITRAGARAHPGFAPSLAQNLFGGHTMMFNAQALGLVRAAGPQEKVVFHDWWIYQLVAGAGGRLHLDPLPMALYRLHGRNVFGTSGLAGAAARLQRVLQGRWRHEMQAHALALQGVAHLLAPAQAEILRGFLAAPTWGPGRVARLRRLGIRRSSAGGTLLLQGAALLGLV
jgi:glycosyltransferase involved in cell wall biosynthesis